MSPIPRRASALASSGWPRSISSHSCHSSTVIFGCWPGRCSEAGTAASARDTAARYARPSQVFEQTASASRRPGWRAWGVCEASLPGSLSSIDANRQPAPIPCRRRRIVATCMISSAVSGSSGCAAPAPAAASVFRELVTIISTRADISILADYRQSGHLERRLASQRHAQLPGAPIRQAAGAGRSHRPLRDRRLTLYVSPMHSVDAVTEQMIRSVLAYAENRLRLDPVPLDQGSQDPAALDAAMAGLPGDEAHNSDQVLGGYSSVIAPAAVSADSPRFLGFIPAAPTKASLLFDMLISCASIQGISWLEAAGAVHAENKVLRLIADRAGLPESAGGCFVSGGSAGNLSALVVAREGAKRKAGTSAAGRRWRAAVGTDAHSSIINTLRILEMDPLIVHTDDHRVTGTALRAAIDADGDPSSLAAVVATSGTTNAGIIDDLAGIAAVSRELGAWFHVDGAYGGAGLFAPSIRHAYDGIEHADSFVVD